MCVSVETEPQHPRDACALGAWVGARRRRFRPATRPDVQALQVGEHLEEVGQARRRGGADNAIPNNRGETASALSLDMLARPGLRAALLLPTPIALLMARLLWRQSLPWLPHLMAALLRLLTQGSLLRLMLRLQRLGLLRTQQRLALLPASSHCPKALAALELSTAGLLAVRRYLHNMAPHIKRCEMSRRCQSPRPRPAHHHSETPTDGGSANLQDASDNCRRTPQSAGGLPEV